MYVSLPKRMAKPLTVLCIFFKHRHFTEVFDYAFRDACNTQLAIPSNIKACLPVPSQASTSTIYAQTGVWQQRKISTSRKSPGTNFERLKRHSNFRSGLSRGRLSIPCETHESNRKLSFIHYAVLLPQSPEIPQRSHCVQKVVGGGKGERVRF